MSKQKTKAKQLKRKLRSQKIKHRLELNDLLIDLDKMRYDLTMANTAKRFLKDEIAILKDQLTEKNSELINLISQETPTSHYLTRNSQ
jgi:hypothetical protein